MLYGQIEANRNRLHIVFQAEGSEEGDQMLEYSALINVEKLPASSNLEGNVIFDTILWSKCFRFFYKIFCRLLSLGFFLLLLTILIQSLSRFNPPTTPAVLNFSALSPVKKSIPISSNFVLSSTADEPVVSSVAVERNAEVNENDEGVFEETIENNDEIDENDEEREVKLPENKTEDIPSFREWTQKALEKEEKQKQEELKNQHNVQQSENNATDTSLSDSDITTSADGTGKTSSSVVGTPTGSVTGNGGNRIKKNYASLDCGAKVVGSNPESTGSQNIISALKDEYMLNKCSDKVWFVIELCESIKALKIEMANFELYSSVPNDFRVSMTNVYPSREWTLFGNFKADESREIQSFSTDNKRVHGKYVKVEVFSHHGNEHYCPISLFRIYGISEIELMANDDGETHVDDDDDDDDDGGGDGGDDGIECVDKVEKTGIVHFIKEKVDETIGRVVDVFNPSNNPSSSTPFTEDSCLAYSVLCPDCDDVLRNNVSSVLTSNLSKLEKLIHSKRDSWNDILKTRICADYGFADSKVNCSSRLRLTRFVEAILDKSTVIALCNLLSASPGQPIGDPIDGKNSSASCPDVTSSSSSSSSVPSSSSSSLSPSPLSSSSSISKESIKEESKKITPTPVESKVPPTASPSTPMDSSSSTSSSASSNSPSAETKTSETVSVPSTNEDGGEKTSSGQRESVWQKLTNRIKSLERNVTFSSGYLEELSVRYKKQIEDLQLSVRQSAESLNAAIKTATQERILRQKLEVQVHELSSVLLVLSEKVDTINTWTVGAHVCFIILEIVIGYFYVSSSKKSTASVSAPSTDSKLESKPSSPAKQIVHYVSTPLKRRHSIEEKKSFSDRLKRLEMSTPTLSRKQKRRIQYQRRRSNNNTVTNLESSSTPWELDEFFRASPVSTANMFGVLNASMMHEDPSSPIKQRSLLHNNNNVEDPSKKRKSIRSLSTSPTRKTEAAKQRENYENFDPEEWRNKSYAASK